MPSQVPDGLEVWTRWLVETYELWGRCPQCWAQHPGVVAELRVLRDWHAELTELSDSGAPTGSSWALWHDYLYRVVARLRREGGGAPVGRCSGAIHERVDTWDREANRAAAAKEQAETEARYNQAEAERRARDWAKQQRMEAEVARQQVEREAAARQAKPRWRR